MCSLEILKYHGSVKNGLPDAYADFDININGSLTVSVDDNVGADQSGADINLTREEAIQLRDFLNENIKNV